MAGLLGIDVSSHQGSVDWAAVKAAGVAYGFTKLTGGTTYKNPYAGEAWAGMKANGLVRGAYHYALEPSVHPMPGAGPEAEAEVFCDALEALGIEAGDLAVLDVEEGDGASNMGEWALRWLARVESRLGIRPFVYTGAWFSTPAGFGECPELAGYPLWLAAYQENMPPSAPPWGAITIWQYTSSASVSGVRTPCDGNLFSGTAAELASYGAGAVLPVYDWQYPNIVQEEDYDCSQTSTLWALRAWGRPTDEAWLESQMLAEGVMSEAYGLMDASGAGLADFLNRHYAELGYVASNDGEVGYDDCAAEAVELSHPLMLGGRNFGAAGHWVGCRGYDAATGQLLLANPAPGYDGVQQSLDRQQFAARGPWSLVRLTHPEAEADNMEEPEYAQPGEVGSGLLEMMAADTTQPAAPSTFLPLGKEPAMIEEAVGLNGVTYRWHIPSGRNWRYTPS